MYLCIFNAGANGPSSTGLNFWIGVLQQRPKKSYAIKTIDDPKREESQYCERRHTKNKINWFITPKYKSTTQCTVWAHAFILKHVYISVWLLQWTIPPGVMMKTF